MGAILKEVPNIDLFWQIAESVHSKWGEWNDSFDKKIIHGERIKLRNKMYLTAQILNTLSMIIYIEDDGAVSSKLTEDLIKKYGTEFLRDIHYTKN